MTHGAFLFDSYRFDPQTGQLVMQYAYENGPRFIETIDFPIPRRRLTDADHTALATLVRLLYLCAGVSYYKAYVPDTLACPAFPLDPVTAHFVETVYRAGLGEFAYKNNLDLRTKCRFDTDPQAKVPVAVPLGLHPTALIPVGGGKDSCVTIEAVRQTGIPARAFVLTSPAGVADPIAQCIHVAGMDAVVVTRTLSPEIITLNQAGAYNGHVPITAILSIIAVIAAVLGGESSVILSNEHSASAPNLTHNGMDVNHQYSKSLAFETDLRAYLAAHVSREINYFSLLRPLTEAAILKKFATLTPYHPVFRSCNTAFKQDAQARGRHWCGHCPKCQFVFLGLAPFLSRDRLVAIFGADLLNDPAQYDGFAALCGVSAHKPFECVGETYECALMLAKIATIPAWHDAAVVRQLAPHVIPHITNLDTAFDDLFTLRDGHYVPDEFLRALS